MTSYTKTSLSGTRNIIAMAILAAGAVMVTTYLRTSHNDNLRLASSATPENSARVSPAVDGGAPRIVPDFTFTDQDNHATSLADLRGKIWVADFIFIGCAGACPQLTRRMVEIQRAIPDQRLQLISFDVDPDHDTPAKLKDYGTAMKADISRWRFLAPPSRAAVFDLAREMRVTNQANDKDLQPLHSEQLFLINGQGRIVGVYDGAQDSNIVLVIRDAKQLLVQEIVPPIAK